MIKCKNCEIENLDTNKYCSACGHSLLDDSSYEDTTIMQLLNITVHGNTKRSARLWLQDTQGDGHIERTYELSDEEVILGRKSDASIVLPGNTVSRNHARITHENGQYIITDMGSTNGTMLNGELLVGSEVLTDSDTIGIGIYQLIFKQ